MTTPFDWIRAISEDTENVLETGRYDINTYEPYIINWGLGLYPDLIAVAQYMNMMPNVPKNLQYEFLWRVVPKKRRFAKWPKKAKDDVAILAALRELYQISNIKALEMLERMTPEDKEIILARVEKGGIQKGKKS